jgi:hypothetical protein
MHIWPLAIALVVSLLPSNSLAQSTNSAGHCKYLHVNGNAWKALDPRYPAHDHLFKATALCRDLGSEAYYPVSGGIRFEGIWNDISIGRKWKLVQGQVYDPDNLPLSGWSCMVMRTDEASANDRPDHLWCSVLCCP